MRRHALPLLLTLLLPALPAAARAQDTIPRAEALRRLPPGIAERVVGLYNDPGTVRLTGPARIAAGSTVTGDVAVLDGSLVVAGRVRGDVVVINGDLELRDGAEVTGDVTVVGGAATGFERARVGGELLAYAERLDYVRRGERIYADVDRPDGRDAGRDAGRNAGRDEEAREDEARRGGDWEEADDDGWTIERRSRRGRADFIVATGNAYNRVEGLPITFGPVFETAGSNPFRLRIMGIFRTETGPELGPERWGFEARAEQFLGGRRAARLGGTFFRRIDPIEDWHLSDLENALSTFFLHRDYRDHYRREGGSVYARVDPAGSPLSSTLELRLEKHRPVEAGSPWSLFNNDDPWRLQPLAAGGTLNSLALTTRIDTRNDERDPSDGWLVRAEVERALEAELGGLTGVEIVPGIGDEPVEIPFIQRDYGLFTHGMIDLRRYNRISASSRLNLRLLAGGALGGAALPPQRQHALGGEGSLPGYGLFSQDCGARERRVDPRPADPNSALFFPAYGCDGFVLGQVEYRGTLSFRMDVGHWGDDDEWDGGDDDWRRFDADFAWVLFADLGRGWTHHDEFEDTETVADVGFGLLFGRLGVYLAVPVVDVDRGGEGVNFFIRLDPRF
ncbi:MAG TPA: polymer-forming cytoskeletal protein [Longimicrobium sp.]|jgi:hypothetical protein